MNGPQHFRAAEELLGTAHDTLATAAQDRANGDTQFADRYEVAAELDLKAAHVHAMLAVAAATAEARQIYTSPAGDQYNIPDPTAGAWTEAFA